jgi:hypothetical protein
MNKAISQLLTRLKHLRGQHDQRDHAWNRGMGGGGAGGSGKRGGGAGVELGPNQMGPLPTMQMYREQRQQLQQQMRDGVITRTEMQTQLDNLRGIIAKPNRRDNASIVLASKRNVKINPSGQNDFFNVVDEAAPKPKPTSIPAPASTPTPTPAPASTSTSNTDRVIKEFLDKFDTSGALLQQRLDAIAKYPPIKWSLEDKTNYEEFILDEYIKKNEYPNQTDYDKYIKNAELNGIQFDEVMRIHAETPGKLPRPVHKIHLMFRELQSLHVERAQEVSKMEPDAQDALYETLIARIAQHKQAMKENPDLAKHNPELANDAEAVMALALYGNPDLRLKAVQYANDKKNGMPSISRTSSSEYFDTSNRITSEIQSIINRYDDPRNISDVINYYSLEYRLFLALSSKLRNNSTTITHMPSGVISDQRLFIRNFTYTHTSETTTNVLGAAIQTALSRIGPNADAPPAPSLYPFGVTPPEPHPKIIEFLQKQYEDTQKELAKKNVSAIELYRGTRNGQVANGIPMSPWSEEESVADGFADDGGYVNAANMLAKYIFMYNKQLNFITEFKNESEYLILETAALEKSLYNEIRDYYQSARYGTTNRADWTIKQLNHKRKNGINVFDESNGIVDYSLTSTYEPQYDIFYNYRKKPKAKSTAKELMHRIKKLHNK